MPGDFLVNKEKPNRFMSTSLAGSNADGPSDLGPRSLFALPLVALRDLARGGKRSWRRRLSAALGREFRNIPAPSGLSYVSPVIIPRNLVRAWCHSAGSFGKLLMLALPYLGLVSLLGSPTRSVDVCSAKGPARQACLDQGGCLLSTPFRSQVAFGVGEHRPNRSECRACQGAPISRSNLRLTSPGEPVRRASRS
jgi:hypothetical protein